jgi:hypothetical protein
MMGGTIMRFLLSTVAVLCAAVLGACRTKSAPRPVRDGGPPPALGVHTLLTYDQGKGRSPVVTAPVTTQATGSTLLAITMGRIPNFATPTDSYGNEWSLIGKRRQYANGPFYTAVWSSVGAKGGPGHTLSSTLKNDPVDEISQAFIEIKNAVGIADAAYRYPKKGEPLVSGSVTTRGPATLVAIWGGDSWSLKHTAVPDGGFQVIASYLDLGPTSGVQVVIATKQVAAAGTYSVTWKATPEQGAALHLIAIE